MEELENIRKVFKFEEMSFDYINQQIEGLMHQISSPKGWIDHGYVQEKIDNCMSQFKVTLENFSGRMKDEGERKAFIKKFGSLKEKVNMGVATEEEKGELVVEKF